MRERFFRVAQILDEMGMHENADVVSQILSQSLNRIPEEKDAAISRFEDLAVEAEEYLYEKGFHSDYLQMLDDFEVVREAVSQGFTGHIEFMRREQDISRIKKERS